MKTKALDKSNCAVARPGGKEASVKPTSPRTEMGYEAGDGDEFAPQHEVPVSASQVKPGVVSRKFMPLPGETCPASRSSRGRSNGTVTGNRHGGPAGGSAEGEQKASGFKCFSEFQDGRVRARHINT